METGVHKIKNILMVVESQKCAYIEYRGKKKIFEKIIETKTGTKWNNKNVRNLEK